MALDFYSTLDRLYNPTNDIGGGGNDAQAYAQLILGGGQAALQDPTTGAMVPIFDGRGSDSAAAENVSPSFSKILKDAEAIAAGARGDMLGKRTTGLVKDPTGPGMYDPTNPAAVAAARQNAQAIDVPYTDPASRMARGQPVGADPTSEAFYSTSRFEQPSRAGSTQGRSQLVANPYGPGSYDPNDPEQVAQVRAAGQQASKADQARQLIKQIVGEKPVTDPSIIAQELLGMSQSAAQTEQIMKNLPQTALAVAQQREQAYNQRQQAANPVVKQILDSLGVNKPDDTFAKAFAQGRGKEMGKASVAGKTKAGVNDVFSAAGSPQFADAIAKASAEGRLTPTQEASAQRLHDQRIKTATPDQKMALSYENAASSLKRLERLEDKYDAAIKGNGSFSQGLKQSLAKNANLAMFLSPDGPKLPLVKNLTPEEASFVTELNSMLIGMRQMYDDNRMSDQDVQNFLRALGDPKTGPQMFKAQLGATGNVIYDRGAAIQSAFKATRKNTEGLSPLEWRGAKSKTPAAKSGAGGWTVTVEK